MYHIGGVKETANRVTMNINIPSGNIQYNTAVCRGPLLVDPVVRIARTLQFAFIAPTSHSLRVNDRTLFEPGPLHCSLLHSTVSTAPYSLDRTVQSRPHSTVSTLHRRSACPCVSGLWAHCILRCTYRPYIHILILLMQGPILRDHHSGNCYYYTTSDFY